MTERERPMKKTVKASEARQQLPQLLNSVYCGDTRVLVERSGIPVAAIVSAHDLEELGRLDQQRADFDQALARMQKAFKDAEEIEQKTNRIVAEVRAQLRAERAAAGSGQDPPDTTRTTG